MAHSGDGAVWLFSEARQCLVGILDLALCQLPVGAGVVIGCLYVKNVGDARGTVIHLPLGLLELVL
ncbi:hypothetical protein D3C80_1935180 [compost metagenome]